MPGAQKTLEEYLLHPFNQGLYTYLEDIPLNPLPFFNFFYHLVGLIEGGNASAVIQELDQDGFQGGVRLFILNCIREYFHHPFGDLGSVADSKHEGALFVINNEYNLVASQFPPDMFPADVESLPSDRARRAVAGSLMVHQVLDAMTKNYIAEGEERARRDHEIELRARQSERERMETTITETVQASIAALAPKRNPEHTLNRQVLALGFMLKHLGVRNVDKTKQAKFIEFLIGKTPKHIYDALREIDGRILLRKGEDARYVIGQFRELELEEIAKDIEETLKHFDL